MRAPMLQQLRLLILFFMPWNLLGTESEMQSPENKIAGYVKSNLKSLNTSTIAIMLRGHLRHLRLLSPAQQWSDPGLASHAGSLLPADTTLEDLGGLVDQMAANAAKNPYLHNFLQQHQSSSLGEFFANVNENADTTIPDVITYAFILERLNQAMLQDWRLLKTCTSIWTREHSIWSIWSKGMHLNHWDPFVFAKILTVRTLFKNTWLPQVEKGHVDPYSGLSISLNIMEAVVSDLAKLNVDNAMTGSVLAWNKPGGAEDLCTSSGPTRLSEGGRGVEWRMPLPLQWADLYTTWNLAFVSTLGPFPYNMVKLLIPSVSGYQEHPEGYLWSRAVALHTHIFYYVGGGMRNVGWSSGPLTTAWGAANRNSSAHYQKLLTQCGEGGGGRRRQTPPATGRKLNTWLGSIA